MSETLNNSDAWYADILANPELITADENPETDNTLNSVITDELLCLNVKANRWLGHINSGTLSPDSICHLKLNFQVLMKQYDLLLKLKFQDNITPLPNEGYNETDETVDLLLAELKILDAADLEGELDPPTSLSVSQRRAMIFNTFDYFDADLVNQPFINEFLAYSEAPA